jgi:hypothetical protein
MWMPVMKTKILGLKSLLLLIGCCLSAGPLAWASETLVNFDDVAAETVINTHYSGLTFTNPIGGNVVARNGFGNAASSPNVVCITNQGGGPDFDAQYGAVDVRFATPMKVVKIDTAPVAPAEFLTPLTKLPFLQAFDANTNLLATVYYSGPLPTNSSQVGPYQTLVYSSPSTNIVFARFTVQNPLGATPTYGLFDNLRYDNGAFTLNVNIVAPPGTGAFVILPLGPYFYGALLQLSAGWFGGSSYAFAGWSGDLVSTDNPVGFFIYSDMNVTATFVHIPQLRITQTLNNVNLLWPTNDTGFTLLTSTQLVSPPAWTIVPNPRSIVGTNYLISDFLGSSQKFYRLVWTAREAIPGLFNTGVATNGTLASSGTVDPHWQMIQSADGAFPGPAAIVLNDIGFPIPPWIANGPNSKWIAPQASEAVGNNGGTYKYRTSFDLTGFEPSSAIVSGVWTSDNQGPQVLLNGVATGATNDGNFSALTNFFAITSGFIAGTNTLDFVVTNIGPGTNPTGVRVELSGTANRKLSP